MCVCESSKMKGVGEPGYEAIKMGRPVARLIERGVHVTVKIMQASGHAKYNLMRFKLIMLVLKYFHHARLVGGQSS